MMKLSKTAIRTTVLAMTAAFTFVWCGIYYFDIPAHTLFSFFVFSIVIVGMCIGFAVVLVFVWRQIKSRRD